MMTHSNIQIKRSVMTDFICRNIQLDYPYNLDNIIGLHGFSPLELPNIENAPQPLADLLNLYFITFNPDYKEAIIRVPGILICRNIHAEIPLLTQVSREDYLWKVIDTILVEGEYGPFGEMQMYEIIKPIIDSFDFPDSLINIKLKDSRVPVIKSSYIQFPSNYQATKMGDFFNIELWLYQH